ncbi:MAG: cytochrome-c peroxidase [Bacteroidetes bacterium]|nr:MAG: cytochrome-c peroxidase [Bacteroidota bacterium]
MKKLTILLLLPAFIFFGCTTNQEKKEDKEKTTQVSQADKDLLTKAQMFFKVLPTEAPNPENTLTDAKIKLGKILYYDNRLSKDETQSCNTCHNIAAYGVDNLATSPGDNGIPGTRNSPTVFNAALKGAQFWDGRNKDVEEQAGGPILNPAEMAIPNEQFLIDRLKKVEMYQNLFAETYSGEKDPFTYKNIRHAIAAFERTLLTPSKFDKYLVNNVDALNEQEKKGLKTFIDQGCIACHTGSLLGGTMLQKFALFGDYWELTGSSNIDYGKFEETKIESDKFMFYVPMLRNAEKTAPYFHDGSVTDLRMAIKIMGKTELNKDLTAEQVENIFVFMKTLTADISAEAATIPAELMQ